MRLGPLGWFDWALLLFNGSLLLTLAGSGRPRLWRRLRRPAGLLLQAAGVLAVTWFVVEAAAASAARAGRSGILTPADTALIARPPEVILRSSLELSLLTLGLAAATAAVAGLGGAIAVVSLRRRRFALLSPLATVLWVAPTFLIALLVQELQADVFGVTGLRVAAGFGEVNAIQVFWVAFILAVRPTAYFFQSARAALDLDTATEYVRTARAKGLSWEEVVRRHIARANAALLATAWLNSFRTMIGAAPLVEFLFGYPGLGRVLILALGLTYAGGAGPVHPDVAIALVVSLALTLILIEAGLDFLEVRLDPRLRMAPHPAR
jgi:peptide/nickel transport system permease protein